MSGDQLSEDFANDDTEAEKRFQKYESEDPFPKIDPALLNSADVCEYVRATGMICPFEPDATRGKLKSASYEVDFLGDLHFVDDSGKYLKETIQPDKQYELKKNSITFLYLKTTFRLPDYMAARFNLRITHVHAGLLLGTGPLIDPGFAGRLLIPLHNLTSENYQISGGEGLIWVEFTKISRNNRWDRDCERKGAFRLFPRDKRYKPATYYLEKASSSHVPIPASSSIPGETKKAVDSASDAKRTVTWLSGLGIVGILGIFYTIYTFVEDLNVSMHSLVQDATKNVADSNKSISDYREHQNAAEKRLQQLEAQFKELCETEQLPANPKQITQRRLTWCSESH